MSALLRSARCVAKALRPRARAPNTRTCTRTLTPVSTPYPHPQLVCRSLATAAARQESIAPLLQRLDEDVRRFGRLNRKDLDEILEEVHSIHTVTSSQSLLIIRCCGSLVPEELPLERTKFVSKIWKTLTKRGIPMDISHYNALLRVYLENEHDFSTADFLKELESKGIEPNRVTYQRLMWQHCQKGDVEGASNILEMMRQKNLPLSEAVLDALVLGHVRQDNLEGAHSVLTAMSTAGLNPTSNTYTILMGGSAKRGDLDRVKELIKECEKKEIYFNDKDLLSVIEEFAAGGHNDHVNYMIEQLERSAGYNQEVINIILRLISRGSLEAAYQLLQSMTRSTSVVTDSSSSYQSAFFIKQLVKSNVSKDTVLTLCQRLEESGQSPRALYIATEAALQMKKTELALDLFKALQSSGNDIRQHFFWPLFVEKARSKNSTDMLKLLGMMTDVYNLPISMDTLKEYVIPNMIKRNDPNKIVDMLREAGVSFSVTVRAILSHLLMENKLKEAAELAGTYGTKGNLRVFSNNLMHAFLKVQDVDALTKFVGLCIDDSTKKVQENEEDSVDGNSDSREIIGRFLNSLVATSSSEANKTILPQILQKFVSNGLGISSKWADEVQKKLGENVTTEISELLSELVADDLKLVTPERGVVPQVRRTPQQLISLITRLEEKGEVVPHLKKQYLLSLIRAKEYEKIDEALKNFDDSTFIGSAGLQAQLLDMYAQCGKLDEALKCHALICSNNPDFIIDSLKILRLTQLMMKENQFDEAISMLEKYKVNVEPEINFLRDTVCWQTLTFLADTGDVEKTNKVFNTYLENNHFKVSNVLLGPLIKVHIVNGNMDKALDTFEECCNKYHSTPWKGELNRKLILEEDAAGLQRLTDLSTLVHGEVNSLYDLVFNFIECGRVKQARKILETPGMRTRNQRFNSICERYGEEGKVNCLEGLLEATRELSHIDRSEVFNQLLNSYIQADDHEKALGLWTLLQEENVAPSDKFLIKLGEYLRAKDIEVPFVLPVKDTVVTPVADPVVKNVSRKHGDVTFKTLIDGGKIEEAGKLLLKNLRNANAVPIGLMRTVINALAQNGNIVILNEMTAFLDNEKRALLKFNTRKCQAIAVSGQTKQLFADLERQLDSAKDEDLQQLDVEFPKGGFLLILKSYPNSYDEVKALCLKYSQRGIKSPINMLWMHSFLKNDHDEAKNIWNEHLRDMEKVKYRSILNEALKQKDHTILSKLLEYVKSVSAITPKAIGSIYSYQVDILLDSGRVEEAENILKEAISNNITPQDFHDKVLNRLKEAVVKSGKRFEYTI